MLSIIATPIGNLEDITLRALRTLKEADVVLCEDTRVTRKLLDHYEISKPLLSYHHHSTLARVKEIVSLLKEGKHLALVSDAGTPGVSDPGNKLVHAVREACGDQVSIVPIPGASSVAAIASVAGFSVDRFRFIGFVPQKKGRQKLFTEMLTADMPTIFFESPYRIIKTLEDIVHIAEASHAEPELVVGRELTKKFEHVMVGGIAAVIERVKKDPQKGEYVVILSPKKAH